MKHLPILVLGFSLSGATNSASADERRSQTEAENTRTWRAESPAGKLIGLRDWYTEKGDLYVAIDPSEFSAVASVLPPTGPGETHTWVTAQQAGILKPVLGDRDSYPMMGLKEEYFRKYLDSGAAPDELSSLALRARGTQRLPLSARKAGPGAERFNTRAGGFDYIAISIPEFREVGEDLVNHWFDKNHRIEGVALIDGKLVEMRSFSVWPWWEAQADGLVLSVLRDDANVPAIVLRADLFEEFETVIGGVHNGQLPAYVAK